MAVVRSDRVDAVRGFGIVQLVGEAGLEVAGCAPGDGDQLVDGNARYARALEGVEDSHLCLITDHAAERVLAQVLIASNGTCVRQRAVTESVAVLT